MKSRHFSHGIACLSALLLALPPARAAVLINETMSAASERLLRYENGVAKVGTGLSWYDTAFSDAGWTAGVGPFGFGTLTDAPTAVATGLDTAVRYQTPTAYFRRAFTPTAGQLASGEQVQLLIEYNDGFVAYLNGVEVARRNAGPVGKFIYHDQPSYNREVFSNTAPVPTTRLTETINLGVASAKLTAGTNVLAIQLLNASATDGTFYLKPNLQVGGASPTSLVAHTDSFKWFAGTIEPSGLLTDTKSFAPGALYAPWNKLTFDDVLWPAATGPIVAGSPQGITGNTNLSSQVIGATPSFYLRKQFTASAARATASTPIYLRVTYDDGFVAYINGVEVARRRMGAANTFTPHDAVADTDLTTTTTETINLGPAKNFLVTGSNMLAVQVHNHTPTNADVGASVELLTSSFINIVNATEVWKYFVGIEEPVPAPNGDSEDEQEDGPNSATDWIELHNDGVEPVSLEGWSLTDDLSEPAKWAFPAGASIPAGGYLVVICDELNITTPPPGGYYHTNFKLDADGESIALYNNLGSQVQSVTSVPDQSPFHSYVRQANGTYLFSDQPTPGAANTGALINQQVAKPTVDLPGRFYDTSVTVTLACTTPGATIRYTTNGTDPTETSAIAAAPLTFTTTTPLKVRAFAAGMQPSKIITHTYLMNQTAVKKAMPAISLVADETQSFYRPFGIMAIVGGGWWSGGTSTAPATTGWNGVWHYWTGNTAAASTAAGQTPFYPVPNVAPDGMAYNAPMQSGKPAERPVSMEVLHNNATPDLRATIGLRAAGSPHGRPRYVLSNQNSATPNSASPWNHSNVDKVQLNIFFRDDLSGTPENYQFVPRSPITKYENFRLRSGKNDIRNPFIRDEYSRRLLVDMGQSAIQGDFVNVFVNGTYKGYYNLVQRPRSPFFKEALGSDYDFDVRNISVMADGDAIEYNKWVAFFTALPSTNPMAPSDYTAAKGFTDLVNAADYLLVNIMGGTADWPGNNYVTYRERASTGKWRFTIWDAEGAWGGFSRLTTYNSFNDLAVTTNPSAMVYFKLKNSPDFRLLMADRIQKHFFGNGALTDTALMTRYNELRGLVEPIITETGGGAFSNFMVNALSVAPVTGYGWLNGKGDKTKMTPVYDVNNAITGYTNYPGRKEVLLTGYTDETVGASVVQVPGLFVTQGLWPATLTPTGTQNGLQITLANPNATGTIYYTTNGTDPRTEGTGAASGILYSTPFSLTQTTTVKARVLNGTEWSPLFEQVFTVAQLPQLAITEIMYQPPAIGANDGDEYEFLEIRNLGATQVSLAGMTVGGLGYTFPAGSVLNAGQYLILSKNTALLQSKYPGLTVFGTYGPTSSLSNGGESITLRDASNAEICRVDYEETGAWTDQANGTGRSLVPILPGAFPSINDGTAWRASANLNGSPGAADPAPTQPMPFDSWTWLNFTTAERANPAIAGPTADPDGDLLPNLIEFALGLNPKTAGQPTQTISLATDGGAEKYLTIAFRRSKLTNGIVLTVENRGDLTTGTWTPNGTVGGPIQVGTPTDHGDGTETVTFRDSMPTTGTNQRHLRLHVTAP